MCGEGVFYVETSLLVEGMQGSRNDRGLDANGSLNSVVCAIRLRRLVTLSAWDVKPGNFILFFISLSFTRTEQAYEPVQHSFTLANRFANRYVAWFGRTETVLYRIK